MFSCQRGNLGHDCACWGQRFPSPCPSVQWQRGDPSVMWSVAPYVISWGKLREHLCDKIRQPRVWHPEHKTAKESYNASLSLLALIKKFSIYSSVELPIFAAAKTFIYHCEVCELLALVYVKDKTYQLALCSAGAELLCGSGYVINWLACIRNGTLCKKFATVHCHVEAKVMLVLAQYSSSYFAPKWII